MSSLLSIGTSGLTAAQVALKTVSNNISNAGTDGYSRQTVQQADRPGHGSGRYTIGAGVDVVAVQRAYSQYLTSAVWSGNTALQGATTTDQLTGTLNGLLADSGNLQGALDDLYGGFGGVANASTSTSARQSLLDNAAALVTVFNTLGGQLAGQQGQINTQIRAAVTDIDTSVQQIAQLNGRIKDAGTAVPNELLDQRDTLVKQLAGYTGISTAAQDDGTVSIYSSAGQVLVSGTYAYGLQAGTSSYDAGRAAVLDPNGNDITARLTGGTLGALIDYRSHVLEPAQNRLGQAAVALASSVNAQQAKGLDLNGNQGADLFSVPDPEVRAASGNTGSATVTAAFADVGALTTKDYQLSYTGNSTAPSAAGWTLTTTDGQSVPLAQQPDGSLTADGLSFSVGGAAQVGDSYLVRPTRQAATGIALTTSQTSRIAAAAALKAAPAAGNAGTGAVQAVGVVDASDANLLGGATIAFSSATDYTVTDAAGNTASGTYSAGTPIQFDGWSLSLGGAPAAGDSFTVAKNGTGLAGNQNALDLAALADVGVLDGGTTTVVGAYGNLTDAIGTAGSRASSDLSVQTSLYDQAVSAQQSGAGVNLDEEAASLIRYQQAYQASAQVISTAQSLFSSLIGAIRG